MKVEYQPKMKVKIKDGFLVVAIPLQTPTASKTGKVLVVASSHGNVATTATVGGKVVYVGLNAYVKAWL